MAQSGHRLVHCTCPLSEVERTSDYGHPKWIFDQFIAPRRKNNSKEKPRPKRGRRRGTYLRTFKLPADSLPRSETIS
jgi:hypothetical protein